jgi:hypothetical protein
MNDPTHETESIYFCTCCNLKSSNEDRFVYYGKWYYCTDCFVKNFESFISDIEDTYLRVFGLWVESNKRLAHIRTNRNSAYYDVFSDKTKWIGDYKKWEAIEKRCFNYFLNQNNKFIDLIKNIRNERNKIIN